MPEWRKVTDAATTLKYEGYGTVVMAKLRDDGQWHAFAKASGGFGTGNDVEVIGQFPQKKVADQALQMWMDGNETGLGGDGGGGLDLGMGGGNGGMDFGLGGGDDGGGFF